MKHYPFSIAMYLVLGFSLNATPIEQTLDGKDFLSVSEIREIRSADKTAYTVPEAALNLSDEIDLLMHFDTDGEIPQGHYRLIKGSVLSGNDVKKIGAGAGRFYTNETTLSVQPTENALFAAGNEPGNFTIQFFINPTVIENNEILLYWSNTLTENNTLRYQKLACSIRNRRLVWSFNHFFRNSKEKIELFGKTALKPKQWSFHQLSYNSELNLLEYSMNGKPEKVLYLTPDGNESSIDCTPLIGKRPHSAMNIGLHFTGRIDELAILRKASESVMPKLFTANGRILFRCLDLGFSASQVNRIVLERAETSGGVVNGYYRISEERTDFILWNEAHVDDIDSNTENDNWTPFSAAPFEETVCGRYLQIAVTLLPDTVAEQAPLLNAVKLTYTPNKPPLPPIALNAVAGNGEVTLDWIPAVDIRIRGYRISYGTEPGHYTQSVEVEKPQIVNDNRRRFTVTGLKNDVVYFFSVQPFDDAPVRQYGDFSQEVSARPGRLHP